MSEEKKDQKELVKQSEDSTSPAEQFVMNVFQSDAVQAKVREHLQVAIRNEMSRMTDVLRDAVRDWVKAERTKHDPVNDSQTRMANDQKLEEFHNENRQLTDDNKKLKRMMQLKEKENAIMQASMKILMKKKGK